MRHLLAYLVFVGIPLGGLFGVLRVGQGIGAPMAIHGAYAVLPMAHSGFACYAYLLGSDDSTVIVTQSGRQVTVTLGPKSEVTLRGKLFGADLTAEGMIAAGTTPRYVACPVAGTAAPGEPATSGSSSLEGRVPRSGFHAGSVPSDRTMIS